MAYVNNPNALSTARQTNSSVVSSVSISASEFYEFEPAVVVDVILDDTHPIFRKNTAPKVDITNWPSDCAGNPTTPSDVDYTWIGRILVRPCFSAMGVDQDKLLWAIPLENTGVVEYPLINEMVIVANYFDTLYYTKKLNIKRFPNNNADFRLEKVYGINNGVTDPVEEIGNTLYIGPTSVLNDKKYKSVDTSGALGRYFLSNNNIRAVKRFEGDTVVESRHGQSIRFSTYDNLRINDALPNINTSGINPYSGQAAGYGNPMILIRNRQRPIGSKGTYQLHPKLPPIPPMSNPEKNAGGYIEEDINNDGSSIHITSGKTESKWKTTCYKSMFGATMEEQSAFSPVGASDFKFPTLTGDQIVINSDRLIFSSRFNETFHFSKKRYSVVTDSEYTVDANDQIVISTNSQLTLNSSRIYLGQFGADKEPAILGQTAINWMFNLCSWLLKHTHIESNGSTGIPVQIAELIELQSQLNTLMSNRVFVTGGGLEPGVDGIITKNTDILTNIPTTK